MGKNMGILGLRIIAIYLLSMCCSSNEVCHYTLMKYKIDRSAPIDSMIITVKGGKYCSQSKKNNAYNKFKFDYAHQKLRFKPENCPTETKISLKVGEVKDVKCGPIFPFVGERVTILDKKVFYSAGQEYTIFKLYNEIGDSNLNNSTVFWVKNHCIIMIKLNWGEYYVIDNWNSDLIRKVKQDLDFSELWPIPPAPPAPQFEH